MLILIFHSLNYSDTMGGDNMTLFEALEIFLYKKQVAGVSSGTVKNYRVTLNLFIQFCGPDMPCGGLELQTVESYSLRLYSTVSRGTAASYIRNIRIFLRWLDRFEELAFDPVDIQVPKSPKKQIHLYTDSELHLIFDMADCSVSWIAARNRALLALMIDSGLRQGEACRLRYDCIDRERKVMKVTGKGAKDRTVSLGDMSLIFLDEYLRVCPYLDNVFVFVDRRGNRISENAVRLFVYRLQQQLSFPLSSHKLRHNYATNYCIDHIKQTGKSDVYDLSILMGHESIETTKRYEHFAHELIAAENHISHLDHVFRVEKHF